MIERLTGVRHHPAWVWALLHHRLGWSVQRPVAAPPNATRPPSTAGSRNDGRGFSKRPTPQSLSGLLRRVRAQPDPQRPPQLGAASASRRCWSTRSTGRRPRWRPRCATASGAAAPSSPSTSGRQLRHRHPDPGAGRAASLPGRGEGHAAVGRAAGPPQPRDAGLARTQRPWLVVERLPAYAPELNPVEGLWSSLKGSRAGQPHLPDPGGGDRPGPPRHPAGPPDPAPGLLVPSPRRPIGRITRGPTLTGQWWRDARAWGRRGVGAAGNAATHDDR